MKGFDVLKIKPAATEQNPMEFRYSHLAGMQIGEVIPMAVYDCVPRDQVTYRSNYFSRLAPLVKPTYGDFEFKTVAGFVPYHMIAADAEAWLAGKTVWEGVTPHHRYFTMQTLVSLFIVTGNGLATNVGATSQNCDFAYVNSSGNNIYLLFTQKGKYYYKIFCALGYTLPTGVDLQASSSWLTNVSSKHLSAYELLCYLKLYNDHMSQSQRFNTSILSNYLNAIKYGRVVSGIWDSSTGEILPPGIIAMLNAVVVNYSNDYFTTAWQSPNNPLASVENISSVNVPSDNVTITDQLTDNVAGLPVAGGFAPLPDRVITFLRSFSKYVRRNNYSGSRAVQQVFSKFGIKTSDYRDHYAELLKVESFPIQVGDVTATADSSGVPLGDYAGKAIMSGNSEVSYKADDYGLFLILGFITVNPMNPYGFNRRVLRTEPLDYFNAEFDGIGADAISVGEVFTNPIVVSDPVLDTAVFGYTERYNAYRFCRDVLTGDFRNLHSGADMSCWHFARNLASVRSAGYLLAQNNSVNTLPQVDSEYNRIFANTSGDYDHFYMICKFIVNAVRPMKNLNQVVDLGEGNTIVPRNGNVVS